MFCSVLTNNIMSKRGFVKLFTHSLHVLLCSHEQHHEQKRFCQVVYPQFTCSALLSRTTSWAKEVLSSCLPTVYMFCSALMNNIMSQRGFVKLFTHSLHVLLCSHEQHHEQKRLCQVVYQQFTCSALLSRTTSWAKEVLSTCLPTVYMFCSALTNNIMSKRGFVKLFTHSLHVLLCSHEQRHEQKRFCQVVYPQFTCSALLSWTTSWAKEVLSSCLPTVYMFCSALTNNIMSKRGFVKLFTNSLHVLLCSHDNNILSKRGFVNLFTHSLHVLLCSHEQHHEQKRFCPVVYSQFTCSALLSRTTSRAKEVLSSCLPTVYMFCSVLTNNIMSKRGFVKLFTHSLHVLLCSHEQHHEQKRFCQVVYPQFTCSALPSRTTSWAKEVLSRSLPQFTCSALLSRTTSWAKEVLSSCLPTVYMFCSALTNNIMSKRGFVKLFTNSLHVLLCSHEQHPEQKRFCQLIYPQFTCSALLSRTTSWAKEVLSSGLPTVYMFFSALTNNIMSKIGFVKLFTHSLLVLLCSHEQHHEQKRFCQVVYPQFTCSALLSWTTSWAKEVLSSCLPTVYMFCSALTNNIMSKRGFVQLFTHSLHVLLCSHEQHHEQKRFCQVVYPQFTCSALFSRTTSWAKEVLSSCLPTVYMFCSALMNNIMSKRGLSSCLPTVYMFCSALTNNIMSKRGFVKFFTHSLHVLLCSHEQHHEQKRFCQVVYPQFTCSALLSRTTSWAKEDLSSCLPTVYMFCSALTNNIMSKRGLSSCLPTVYMFCSALTNNIMSKRGFVKLFTHSFHVLLCSHEQHHEQKRFCQVLYPQFTCSALLSRTTSWAKEVLSSCLPTVYMFCSALTNNIMSKRGFVKLFTHSLHVLLCSHEQHHEQKRFCQVLYPQFTCSALLSRTTSWAKEVLSSCLPTVYMFCSALTNNIMSKRGFVKLFTHSLHVLLCSHEQHHEQKRFCQVVYPQFTCSALLSRTTSWAKEVLSSCLPTVYMFCSALMNNIMSQRGLSSCLPTVYMFCSALTNNIMSKRGFVKLFTHSLHVLLCSHEQHPEQKRFCQLVYPQFTCSALLSRTTSWAKEVLSSCLPTVYMSCSALTNNIMSKRVFVKCLPTVYMFFSALTNNIMSKIGLSSCLPTVYLFCSALTNNIMSKRGFVKLFTHSLHVLLCSHEQHHEQKRFCQVVYPQFTCSDLLSRTTSWAKEVLSSCLPTVYMFCSALTNNIMSKRGFVKLFTHSLHVLLCSHEQHHEQKSFCQVVLPTV